jgi:hypothetical protein
MNNVVVTINRKTLLSDYSDLQKTNGVPEPAIFFGGVFLWLILPKLVYVDAGGPISPSAFAILAFAGIIGGVIGYLYPAPKPLSIIGPGSVRQSPSTWEPTQRKAA